MLSDYNCRILDIIDRRAFVSSSDSKLSPQSEELLIDNINKLGALGFHKLICPIRHEMRLRVPLRTKRMTKELELKIKQITSRRLSGKFKIQVVPVTDLTVDTPYLKDLKYLIVPKTNYIFLELPFGQFPEELAATINKILYVNKLIPVFTNFQIYAWMYKEEDVKRLINIKGAAFQFSLNSFVIEQNIKNFKHILRNGGAVLLGSSCSNFSLNRKEIEKCLKILRRKLTEGEYTTLVLRARALI